MAGGPARSSTGVLASESGAGVSGEGLSDPSALTSHASSPSTATAAPIPLTVRGRDDARAGRDVEASAGWSDWANRATSASHESSRRETACRLANVRSSDGRASPGGIGHAVAAAQHDGSVLNEDESRAREPLASHLGGDDGIHEGRELLRVHLGGWVGGRSGSCDREGARKERDGCCDVPLHHFGFLANLRWVTLGAATVRTSSSP